MIAQLGLGRYLSIGHFIQALQAALDTCTYRRLREIPWCGQQISWLNDGLKTLPAVHEVNFESKTATNTSPSLKRRRCDDVSSLDLFVGQPSHERRPIVPASQENL